MRGTFTVTDAGGTHRVRVNSSRRYVVVQYNRNRSRYEIVYRTDDRRRADAAPGTVIDTHTGETGRR